MHCPESRQRTAAEMIGRADANRPVPRDSRHAGSARQHRHHVAHLRLSLCVLFLTGFSGLIYEIVWARTLTLTFGGTVLAASAVLCAFMGGLALGSWASGRWADRVRSPALLLTGVLVVLGGVALALIPFLSWLREFYVVAHRLVGSSMYALTGIRFILSVLVLVGPAALVAAVFPVVTKLTVAARGRIGQGAALAYGIDTLGGVAGAAVGGFLLLPRVGVVRTIAVAVCLNLIAAGLAAALHVCGLRNDQVSEESEAGSRRVTSSGVPLSQKAARLLMFGFAVSGAAALSYEVLLTKALMNILGMHAHAFTTMLSCFLFGLGAGSLLSMWALRRRTPLYLFALAEAGIGLIGLSLPVQFAALPQLISLLQQQGLSFWAGRAIIACAVMLPATLLMGTTLPLLLPVLTPSLRRLGRTTGALYSVNTLGGVAGVFLSTFVLLPFLGFKGGMLVAGGLNVLVALLALHYSGTLSIRLRGMAAVLIVLAGAQAARTSAAQSLRPVLLMRQVGRGGGVEMEIRHYSEGANGTVAVVRVTDKRVGYRDEMWVNGGSEGGSDVQSLRGFQLLGHLPFFLHPDPERPKRTLVCAFGMGIALGAVVQDRSESVDCVELVPEVLEAARLFGEYNHNALDSPKVNVHIEDARNFLLATQRTYDVIVADATHPKSGDSWMLYTREFYEDIEKVLAERGVCAQWVPMHGLSVTDFWSIVRTFQSVFPHTSLWSPPGSSHTVFVGTSEPLRMDFQRIARCTQQPALQTDFEQAEFTDVYSVLSCFVAGEDVLAARAAHAPINTDDLSVVQYSGGKSPSGTFPDAYPQICAIKENALPYSINLGDTAAQSARVAQRITDAHHASKLLRRGLVIRAEGGEEMPHATSFFETAHRLNPNDRDLEVLLGLADRRLRQVAGPGGPPA
jgi:spermidine synthase